MRGLLAWIATNRNLTTTLKTKLINKHYPLNTKGSALVIPLLPPRARERGREKLSRTHERRLFRFVQGQGCAPPVLPFAGSVKLDPTSRERGPGPGHVARGWRAGSTRSHPTAWLSRQRCPDRYASGSSSGPVPAPCNGQSVRGPRRFQSAPGAAGSGARNAFPCVRHDRTSTAR